MNPQLRPILWCLIAIGPDSNKFAWIDTRNLRRWINRFPPKHIKPIRWTRTTEVMLGTGSNYAFRNT